VAVRAAAEEPEGLAQEAEVVETGIWLPEDGHGPPP
jgi:hypothetical protein